MMLDLDRGEPLAGRHHEARGGIDEDMRVGNGLTGLKRNQKAAEAGGTFHDR